ncbi:hypothetical protein GOBAR_AA32252 [Gossypium barbadense]|uniref:Uncharacterized protein n=1 Tax=Gossypium barbadense TaxID=3634 RepID=A0A2P5WBH9_GOSBA|nr:hypothetical protein GOBAR_AA32252 [Gossypium barbadense]
MPNNHEFALDSEFIGIRIVRQDHKSPPTRRPPVGLTNFGRVHQTLGICLSLSSPESIHPTIRSSPFCRDCRVCCELGSQIGRELCEVGSQVA